MYACFYCILLKQYLLINSTLVQLSSSLLWKLFREERMEHHGVFLNLATLKSNPLAVGDNHSLPSPCSPFIPPPNHLLYHSPFPYSPLIFSHQPTARHIPSILFQPLKQHHITTTITNPYYCTSPHYRYLLFPLLHVHFSDSQTNHFITSKFRAKSKTRSFIPEPD